MGKPVARMNDPVTGTDIHIVLVPSATGTVPTPLPHPYAGRIVGGCVTSVLVNGQPVAVDGSTSQLNSPHIPQGGSFSRPPTGTGRVVAGPCRVLAGGQRLACLGDQVITCNDPVDAPTSTITAASTNVVAG
ncbi:MAG: hypothetical protein KDB60_12980 [Propionibacteriaceae bacterium]|nr:hypothetical protein [Propionibacteriaceae bacterium]